MDPSEVPLEVGVTLANEVSVDVEVGISDEAKILVFVAVEVECDAVSTYESRVLAYSSRKIATCASQ